MNCVIKIKEFVLESSESALRNMSLPIHPPEACQKWSVQSQLPILNLIIMQAKIKLIKVFDWLLSRMTLVIFEIHTLCIIVSFNA